MRYLLILLSLPFFFSVESLAQTQGPEKGSLIIIGGGRLDSVFYGKFMELAGGPEAEIVVIPTASGSPGLEDGSVARRIKANFEARGFKKVSVLHTNDPAEADTEDFVKPLTTASGVWITGGRQWRLVDSYLHNRTHQELKKVLERGGVIAGSSAGATIQGSYLARGDTKTNTIMMGDHEEGMAFVTQIAIDQHVLARNRQFDMFRILDHHPELLGISLDENTGIVVQGDECEVIGASYALIYDGTMWHSETGTYKKLPPGSRQFYMLDAGSRYHLKDRKVISP
ncbi:MAG: cyanophycinase [Bacteroidota bacterium]